MSFHPFLVFQLFIIYYAVVDAKKPNRPIPYVPLVPSAKYDNPNYIKDRSHNKNMSKPQMPDSWNNRHRQPFNGAWMDYCAKYHCDDYHKLACGLNRKNMKFKWFQSQCHIILNNQCAYFRGLLKYDIVDPKFCTMYVMNIRSGCPRGCEDVVAPVCAMNDQDGLVVFKNSCELEMTNCNSLVDKYEEVNMSICDHKWPKI